MTEWINRATVHDSDTDTGMIVFTEDREHSEHTVLVIAEPDEHPRMIYHWRKNAAFLAESPRTADENRTLDNGDSIHVFPFPGLRALVLYQYPDDLPQLLTVDTWDTALRLLYDFDA